MRGVKTNLQKANIKLYTWAAAKMRPSTYDQAADELNCKVSSSLKIHAQAVKAVVKIRNASTRPKGGIQVAR